MKSSFNGPNEMHSNHDLVEFEHSKLYEKSEAFIENYRSKSSGLIGGRSVNA